MSFKLIKESYYILFYYPPQAVFDPYRGIYSVGYVFCIQRHLRTMDNVWYSSNILEIMLPITIYYISLKRSFYSASAHFCCIKIHEEMAKKSQVKD